MILLSNSSGRLFSNKDLDGMEDMPYMASLFFPTGGSTITAGHRDILSKLVGNAGWVADPYYHVTAMASRLGDQASNQALSERRLAATLPAMTRAGVPSGKVTKASARGEDLAELIDVPDGNNDQIWRTCTISLYTANPQTLTAQLRAKKLARVLRVA